MRIAIYGCSGFGREVAPIARDTARRIGSGTLNEAVVFVDDDVSNIGTIKNGIHVISFDELQSKQSDRLVVVAVGSSTVRRAIVAKCEAAGLKFASVSAPSARFLDEVSLGDGAIFCDFSMVTSNVRIGRHFHANIYSYVAHDCVVGDFVTLAPKACVNGNVILEDDVYVGTGAVIKQGTPEKPLRIGKGAIVGMGAVVTKDVQPGAVVVGNPARVKE